MRGRNLILHIKDGAVERDVEFVRHAMFHSEPAPTVVVVEREYATTPPPKLPSPAELAELFKGQWVPPRPRHRSRKRRKGGRG